MPKYLRQRGSNDLYVYTDILAARADMIPVDEFEPAAMPVPAAAEPQASTPPSLRWTKDQLLAHAETLGMILDDSLSKAEILALIEPDHAGA